ncbi:ATP-binding cassette domain-containing protein [Mycoplasma sp. 613B]
MKKYFSNKWIIIFFTIFYLFTILSSSLLVLYLVNLIDAIEQRNWEEYNKFIIANAVLSSLFVISTFCYLFLKNKLNMKINQTLTKDAITKISSISNYEIEKNKEGKYLIWIKERIPEITSLVFEHSLEGFLKTLTNIVVLIIMFFISWKLALIGIAVLILAFIIPLFLSILAGKINEKYIVNQENLISSLQTVFNGFKILYYLNKEEKIIQLVNSILNNWIKEINTKKSKVILLELINSFFQIISSILLLFIAGYFIFYLNEPVGTIFVIPSFFMGFAHNFREIIMLLQYFGTYKEYIKEFTGAKEITKENIVKQNIDKIEVESLDFNYEEKEIFKNFNFTFEKGKKYALIGKSGSGKSTLLNILLKQIDDYKGNIRINGKDLREININNLKENLIFLSNREELFFDSIYNNISLWEENQEQKVQQALLKVNLENLDLNRELKQDDELSVGEKQRINIARYFFKKPDLLILDEAMSNIDEKNAKIILENIFKNNPNLLFINCTHHLKNPEFYDHVIELKGDENE